MKNLIIPAMIIIASTLLVVAGAQEPAGDPRDIQNGDARPGRVQPENAGPEEARPETAQSEGTAPSYVGARKCKVCHLEIFKSWEKTRHAWALASLEGDQLQEPRCLKCHTTGFGSGGYGGKSGVANLGGVQCEACHGPGSLYSRSSVMRSPELCVEMGLVRPDSTTCVTCHNSESPTFKGFAYKAGLSTGTHSR
jgi:hypothetical protein